MDRGVSPSPSPSTTTTTAHHARAHAHDLGRPRRGVASYRLFPIVEPTPPPSPAPVTLQRTTLSRASAGFSRRRSSSLDHGARPCLPASRQTTLPATTSPAARKGSLPDLRPLHPLRDRDQYASHPPAGRALKAASDVRAQADENAHTRSNSAPGESSKSNAKIIMANDVVQSHVNQHAAQQSSRRQPSTPVPHDIRQDQVHAQRHRAKPKPNLRIAIAKTEKDESPPPPPPPSKSPRHWKNDTKSENLPKRDSHSPISPATLQSYLDLPQTPHNPPKLAQQPPLVPLSGGVKDRELTVSSISARPRTASEQSPKMCDAASTTLQAPASKFSAFPTISRPNTSNGPVPCSSTRTSSLPPKRSLVNLQHNNLSTVNISRPLHSPAFVPSVFASEPRPSSRNQMSIDHAPSTPTQDQRPANANQQQSPSPGSIAEVIRKHAASQPQSIGSTCGQNAAKDMGEPDSNPRRSPNAALAAVAAARARVAALQSAEPTAAPSAESESPMKRAPNAALAAVAAAGATNVAALQIIESPPASPRIMTYGVSPSSESGSISRSLMTELLSRQPSAPQQSDPVETLRSISEQREALHEKYASLRVERQKVSNSIIAKLKDQKPDLEYCNMLLDEQLSLAATSSSMDICIAKLKSLECRREDTIAALIAQTSQNKTSPTDNIAAMIASMAISRKTSFAPSMDSGSRFIPTGRSTPDVLVDGFSANRSTCSSFPRTASYASDADSYDYRLSGTSRSDVADVHSSDNSLKIGESPQAKRRTPLHEPSEALEQLKEESDSLNEPPTGVVSPLSRESFIDQMSHTDGISRPSSSNTSTVDELFEPLKQIRVDGAKAAKILGMMSQDGQRSPLIKLPDGIAKPSPGQQTETEVEIELDSYSYKPRARAADPPTMSPLKDLDAPLKSPFSGHDDLDSPSLQDLDVQLGNFPKPAPSVPPKDNSRSLPPPPSMPPPPPPKYSNTHSEQQQMRRRRHDSSLDFQQQNYSVGSNTKRPLSQKSAHTIQVYLDHDQDDLLELYKLRSAALAVS
ncbi:uncharacterized protein MYCFIDRAFT_213020 [Pseudocercospora fijiensis CIRAD86]|uniref:Uncharacterized protein n=1 Tax=Pseudocercospora fijiensis (strain CIRAD86) TaxID=383855 RepID=N1QA61_PSEFD|nr:uncharacterized protein MYCFIDRAFT_213020 [Pseudocercospora fijiensis CIRAD86]EME87793.1 hypothetical protein MYCFIDRAFT_213020 [Pseudocercospora fijiensis CIRAD86]